MSSDKPMTLADARSRAETMARMDEARFKDFPGNINAGQWRVDSQMFRLLLAASANGPTTHNVPTGAGDYDIVCEGCGEIVATPHSWAECCAAQKKMVASLRAKMDEVVEEEREACADIARDIFIGNTEIPRKDAVAWMACAEFILDEIRGRG
jgi:hypothetical protein